MTAVIVFLIVACIAILSAALMLVAQNAVHAAMFLVINFMCVAFFFLTLGAPFIALVQIAVYAGAIMVLFLFVIMLLGAERVPPSPGPYRWLPRAAIVLGVIFLITAGAAIASGEINRQEPPPARPQVRVIHAASTAAPVDVYLNNELFLEGMDFRDVTDYVAMPAGEYGVTVFPAGADPATESPAMLGSLILTQGDAVSLVALGAGGAFQLVQLLDNLAPPEGDQARLTVLNGLPDVAMIDLVDPGLESVADDSAVLIARAGFGEPVETLLLNPVDNWTLQVIPTGGDEPVVTYTNLDLRPHTNNLLLPAPEELAAGGRRVVPLRVETPTLPPYGSPLQVGGVLFTTFLLPFELVGILLLVAMVGAIVLTRRELLREARPRRPIVRRPLVGPQSTSALAAQAPTEADVEQLAAEPEAGP